MKVLTLDSLSPSGHAQNPSQVGRTQDKKRRHKIRRRIRPSGPTSSSQNPSQQSVVIPLRSDVHPRQADKPTWGAPQPFYNEKGPECRQIGLQAKGPFGNEGSSSPKNCQDPLALRNQTRPGQHLSTAGLVVSQVVSLIRVNNRTVLRQPPRLSEAPQSDCIWTKELPLEELWGARLFGWLPCRNPAKKQANFFAAWIFFCASRA